MQNKEEVFLYMKEEIENLAKEEEEKLLQEAETLEKEIYAQIREEAKKEIENQLEMQLAELVANVSNAKASTQVQRKKQLVDKRESCVGKVFQAAKEALVAFTETKEYEKYLKEQVKKISETYVIDEAIAYVKKEDLQYQKEICKAYGKEIEVIASEQVTIGGFIIKNEREHIVIDESLDFILENQKEWFCRTSGLTIE